MQVQFCGITVVYCESGWVKTGLTQLLVVKKMNVSVLMWVEQYKSGLGLRSTTQGLKLPLF